MEAECLLESRVRDRSLLRARIERHLEADPRVSAAWLKGSGGLGQMDALSDLDVVVVARESELDAIAGDPARPTGYQQVLASPRGRWVGAMSNVLLLLEAAQNAPAGGKALTSFYAMPAGPQQVDWEWQTWPGDTGGENVLVLLDRRPSMGEGGQKDTAAITSRSDRAPATDYEVAQHAIPWFCATTIWNAKALARSKQATPPPMQDAVDGALDDLGRYLGRYLGPQPDPADPSGSPGRPTRDSPFSRLADAVERFESLHTSAPGFFAGVPTSVGTQLRLFIRAASDFTGQLAPPP